MSDAIGKNYLEYKFQDWLFPKIEKQIVVGDLTILLLKVDWTKMPPENGRRNLIATNKKGEIVWVAQLPNSYPIYGAFHHIELKDKLLEATCGSFLCEIVPETGKIISETFTK